MIIKKELYIRIVIVLYDLKEYKNDFIMAKCMI